MAAWPASVFIKPQLQQRRCSRSAALAWRIVQQAHGICILLDSPAFPEVGHRSPELAGTVRGSGPVQLTKAQHGIFSRIASNLSARLFRVVDS